MPLDRATIPQDQLNIASKVRSNLLPWNGQFSPQLVSALLDAFARPCSFVLDCFAGSGTVLAEAGRAKLAAFGADINPAACHMSALYTLINTEGADRRAILSRVDDALHDTFDGPTLFSPSTNKLVDADVKSQLAALWQRYDEQPARLLLAALIVLIDFYRPGLTPERVLSTWATLKAKVASLPYSPVPLHVANCDARQLLLPSAAADLVLTSPPYINVFNYHQQYRASAEALGWNLLHVARSEIGSNRKHRGNRFLTVVQYCLDMTDVFLELRRACSASARIILIIGRESNVRRTRFLNGEIALHLAVRCARLSPDVRQERVFQNKFGQMIFEDILHLRPLPMHDTATASPYEVACEVLTSALAYAPAEARSDLKRALDVLPNVNPSPIYSPQDAKLANTP